MNSHSELLPVMEARIVLDFIGGGIFHTPVCPLMCIPHFLEKLNITCGEHRQENICQLKTWFRDPYGWISAHKSYSVCLVLNEHNTELYMTIEGSNSISNFNL